jgi:hypothetical protein
MRGVCPTRRTRLSIEALEGRCLPSFSPVTSFPAGTDLGAMVTADFNNDGHLDLATSNYDPTTRSRGVSVLLGDGQGGFGAPRQSAGGASGGALAAGDFNNDGNLDLATSHDYAVRVRLGNGDGTFQSPFAVPIQSGQTTPVSVGVADFNADQKMDLVVVTGLEMFSGTGGYIEVLLGDGAGVFRTSQLTEYFPSPYSLAIDDLNADGIPDVVVTDYGDGNVGWVGVWLGNGDGTLGYGPASGLFATARYPMDVAVGDFTGDGIPDLVTISNVVGGSLNVLPGRGDGTFAARISSSAYPGHSLVTADFNDDGRLDVLVAGEGSDDYGPLNLFLGRGNGTFEGPEDVDIRGWDLGRPDAGDYNGDGRPDLAVGVNYDQYGTNSVAVMLNDGDWAPQRPSLRIGDVTVAEGNTGTRTATFSVTLSAASTQPVTVAYATGNGSATAGSDYRAASGTLTFAPGETSKTLTVLVNGDRSGEPNETFVVNLSSPTNATIADGQGVGTILDDEPRVSISDVTKTEGKNRQKTLFTFTVTLSAAYDQAVTMSFQTLNGTATTSNNDYIAKTGTLTFAPGETSKTITIEVKGDSKREANETFYLDLFGLGSNALFTKNRGLGTILNDD